MISAVKKMFQAEGKGWSGILLFALCGTLFGTVLMFIVTQWSGESESYFQLGTVIGCLVTVLYSGLVTVFGMASSFNLEISLGCIRKHFFWSYYLVNAAANSISVLLLLLLCVAERAFLGACFPKLANEVDLFPYLLRAGIPVAILMPMAAMLMAALIMRFGKVASWTLWFLWMFTFIGVPRFTDAAEVSPHSFMGAVGQSMIQSVQRFSLQQWSMVGAAVCLISFALSYVLIRRQRVTY